MTCERCDDTGFLITTREGREFATPCACRRTGSSAGSPDAMLHAARIPPRYEHCSLASFEPELLSARGFPTRGAELDLAGFEPSPLIAWLRAHAGMTRSALARAFNLGVGMLMIAPLRHAARVEAELQGWNELHARVGRVVEGDGVLIAG